MGRRPWDAGNIPLNGYLGAVSNTKNTMRPYVWVQGQDLPCPRSMDAKALHRPE